VTEDVAGCILIPAQRHSVIVEGLKMWFYGKRGVDFNGIMMNQKQYYENEKNRAINQLMNRNQESSEAFTPDLSSLG